MCTSCHSRELIDGTLIPPAGWKAEVEKMKKWGALVHDEQVEPLAVWLAARLTPASVPPTSVRIDAADVAAWAKPVSAPSGNVREGEAAWAQSCASCHGAHAEGTGGGPTLLEHPVLQQPAVFARVVTEGRGRMPAFPLPPEQIGAVAAWLHSLR
jgi:mono/diheme cytochrome c family protein